MTICIKDFNCNRWFKKNYGSREQENSSKATNLWDHQKMLPHEIYEQIRGEWI